MFQFVIVMSNLKLLAIKPNQGWRLQGWAGRDGVNGLRLLSGFKAWHHPACANHVVVFLNMDMGMDMGTG
jgi:hypothetical protein